MSINYLELAQDFIDSNKKIPNDILLLMNSRERELTNKMLMIKNQLRDNFDSPLDNKTLYLKKDSNSLQKKYRPNIKFLYAAVALLAVIIYFPINKSIETRILLKEETSRFVDQLFQENGETYIIADSGITEAWFTSIITAF